MWLGSILLNAVQIRVKIWNFRKESHVSFHHSTVRRLVQPQLLVLTIHHSRQTCLRKRNPPTFYYSLISDTAPGSPGHGDLLRAVHLDFSPLPSNMSLMPLLFTLFGRIYETTPERMSMYIHQRADC